MNGASFNSCCQSVSCKQRIIEDLKVHIAALAVGLAFLALAITFCCLSQMNMSIGFLVAALPFTAFGIVMIVYNKCVKKTPTPPPHRSASSSKKSQELSPIIPKPRHSNLNIVGKGDAGMFFLDFKGKMTELGLEEAVDVSFENFKKNPEEITADNLKDRHTIYKGTANDIEYVAFMVTKDELWVFSENSNKTAVDNAHFYRNGKLQTNPFNDSNSVEALKKAIADLPGMGNV